MAAFGRRGDGAGVGDAETLDVELLALGTGGGRAGGEEEGEEQHAAC